jgi:hypothetical protein
LLAGLGFEMRSKGSHHIFRKAGIEENQPPARWQSRQASPGAAGAALILKYRLGGEQ